MKAIAKNKLKKSHTKSHIHSKGKLEGKKVQTEEHWLNLVQDSTQIKRKMQQNAKV